MGNSCKKSELTYSLLVSAAAGFILGFVAGGAVVAVYDYFDDKREAAEQLQKASDENYYFSAD